VGRAPQIVELLQQWGGVTIAYRRRLIDSPSYTLNHEEVEKALEEGIRFAEGLTPVAVEVDSHGHACALEVSQHHNDGDGVWHEFGRATLPARTILVAAGTQPNTVLAREEAQHFHLDGKYFRLLDEDGQPVTPVKGLAKPSKPAVVTELRADGRAMSFFGDLHPSFHGNVVKAMASATQGYPIVSRLLDKVAPASDATDAEFLAHLDDELRATLVRVERLTPTIVEVVVRAPAAARRFRPGQFYRLQNFESLSRAVDGTRLAMEGLALTGAWVDPQEGLVSTIVLEMGGSSDLCSMLKPGWMPKACWTLSSGTPWCSRATGFPTTSSHGARSSSRCRRTGAATCTGRRWPRSSRDPPTSPGSPITRMRRPTPRR